MQSLNVVFTGKTQLEIRQEPVAQPGPGQALVRTTRSLISTGTECICYTRNFAPGTHWDNWVKYPFYPGYSAAGVVLAVGEGVTQVKEGDRVALRSGHRQYHVVNAGSLMPIPEGVEDEAAPWFALACIVQNGVRRATHYLGDNVVIIGLGLLGQLAVQYIRLFGARQVIAIDTAPRRLEMALQGGATQVLNMGAAEAREQVLALTGGRGADVVYDVTGHPAVFQAALALPRRFGQLLLLGDTGEPSKQCLTSDVMTRGVTITAAHDCHPPEVADDYHFWTRDNMALLFFDYLARGQMNVDPLITHRFAPTEAAAAYDLLLTDRANAMGVIFEWDKLS